MTRAWTPCVERSSLARSRVLSSALLILGAAGSAAGAQQPAPPPAPSPAPALPPQAPTAPSYRAPTIVLVQPAPGAGATVPHDRPVVMFRFAEGEASDPIDARSFAVVVDGQEKTQLFRVVVGEAWGPLAESDHPLALGPHQVTARVCSVRGACSAVSATVIAVADPASAASRRDAAPPAASRRVRLLELVLDAARKLLTP